MYVLSLSNLIAFLYQAILGVGYIQSSNLFPEPLTSEEERECLLKMNDGDEKAKNILIEHNLRLVAHISKKYASTGISQDDLISIGSIGLIKGINSYDINKNFKLATYIARCIENEILMYLRSIKKQSAEVALNEPIGKDKDDNVITLQEILESSDKNVEDEVDLKMNVKTLYQNIQKVLKNRERLIIEWRFGINGKKPQTQNEIAQKLGISRSYVSRIESKAISKLAKEMNRKLKICKCFCRFFILFIYNHWT